MKSNIDYLREQIGDGETEWLDAIEEEINELNSQLKEKESEIDGLETEVNELEKRVSELEDEELSESIDAGIGTIEWKSDNLQLQQLMESLGERIKSRGALKTLQLLQGSALPHPEY